MGNVVFLAKFNPTQTESNRRYFPKEQAVKRAQLSALKQVLYQWKKAVTTIPVSTVIPAIKMATDGFLRKTNGRFSDGSYPL